MNQSLTLTGSPGALAAALAAFAQYDASAGAPVAAPQPVAATPVAAVQTVQSQVAAVNEALVPVMPEVVAAAPTIAGEPEFDASGLAWDARIHSAQKGQTKQGLWRKKRDLDEAIYKAVEAELRARYGSTPVQPTAAPVMPVAAPQPVIPMPTAYIPVPPMPTAAQAMPVPTVEDDDDEYEDAGNEPVPLALASVATVPAATVAAPATSEPITFHTIMMTIGTGMQSGIFTPDYLVALVAEINQQFGLQLASFTDMAAHPQTFEYCWGAFRRDGKV